MRNRAFRVVGGLIIGLGLAGPLLASSFFFFEEDHTRAEMLASNVFLWSFVFAFLLLPPMACRTSGHTTPVFNSLTPAWPESVVLGRFLGRLAGYLVVALPPLVVAFMTEWIGYSGRVALLLSLTVLQLSLGALLISGVELFAQVGGVLLTSLLALLWFLLGTQKEAILDALGSILGQPVGAVGLCWLPDFVLLQIGGPSDPSSGSGGPGLGSVLLYSLLFVCFNLALASLVLRVRWGRTR